MSIESSSPPPNSRAVAGAGHNHGKKLSKPEAGGSVGGFSALINLLSATDPQDGSVADTSLTSTDSPEVDGKNMPLAPINNGLSAIDVVADQLSTLTAAENAMAMTMLASSEQPEPIASAAMAASDLPGFPVLTGSADSGGAGVALPGAVPALVSSLPVVLAERVPQPSMSSSQSGFGRLDVLDKSSTSIGEKPGLGQLATEPSVQSQMDSIRGLRPAAVLTQAIPVELSSSPVVLAGRVLQPPTSATKSGSGRLDVLDKSSTSIGEKPGLGQLATEPSVQSQMDSIRGLRPAAVLTQAIPVELSSSPVVLGERVLQPPTSATKSGSGRLDVFDKNSTSIGEKPSLGQLATEPSVQSQMDSIRGLRPAAVLTQAIPVELSSSPVVLGERVLQPPTSATKSGSGRLDVFDKNSTSIGDKPGLGQLATEPSVQSQMDSIRGLRPAAVLTQAMPVELSSSPVVLGERVPQPSMSSSQSGYGRLDVLDKSSTSIGDKPGLGQLATEPSVQSQMDSIRGQRPAAGHPQGLSSVQLDLREVKTQSVLLQQANAPDVSTALSMLGAGDVLPFPKERFGAKPGSSSGAAGSGFEGVFGSAATGYALADAAYKIESPSAVVPEAAIAETVSYWVTHGVQSAELTLDGPDNKPVEVSIVLNGDQAQIEFRTDQAGMRLILESATTHLKDLLSDQGLQLAGVSVGAFGAGGTPGDGRQQKPAARQTVWVSAPQAVPSLGRSANPSVGRTLDLFV